MTTKWYEILNSLVMLKMQGVNLPLELEIKLEEFTKLIEAQGE